MPVANAIVLVLLNHEVVVDIAADGLLERAKNSATVILASQGAHQALRIDAHSVAPVGLRAFNDFNLHALGLVDLFLWHNDRHHGQFSHAVHILLKWQSTRSTHALKGFENMKL